MANTELVTLCVDVVKNPARVQQFSKGKDADTAIREKFFEIMGTDKPSKKDIRRHEVAIFEIIEDVLTETYLNGVNEDEFFMRFAEVKNLKLGDQNEFFVEDDAVLYVSEHAGNHWNISKQKLEGGVPFRVKTKSFAAAVYGDFHLFITGRLSFAKLVSKVAQAIQNKIYSEVSASFAAATAQLPAAFKATGAYDQAELVEIVAHVEAATGSQPLVIGTRQALDKVTAGLNVALYSDAMKNELANTGRVANVNGMTLVQLPNVHKSNTFDFAYDPNKLFILPANDERFIKLVFEGDDEVKEIADNKENEDMTLEYGFITTFGAQVVFSTLFGIYEITA